VIRWGGSNVGQAAASPPSRLTRVAVETASAPARASGTRGAPPWASALSPTRQPRSDCPSPPEAAVPRRDRLRHIGAVSGGRRARPFAARRESAAARRRGSRRRLCTRPGRRAPGRLRSSESTRTTWACGGDCYWAEALAALPQRLGSRLLRGAYVTARHRRTTRRCPNSSVSGHVGSVTTVAASPRLRKSQHDAGELPPMSAIGARACNQTEAGSARASLLVCAVRFRSMLALVAATRRGQAIAKSCNGATVRSNLARDRARFEYLR